MPFGLHGVFRDKHRENTQRGRIRRVTRLLAGARPCLVRSLNYKMPCLKNISKFLKER